MPPPEDDEHDRIDAILTFVAGLYPDRDTTAKAVAWRLRRAAHHIDTEVRRRLLPQGIDLWELEILSALNRAGGTLTMGELLDIAQLTSGAITNRVARLEREGRVRREIAPGDRRQVLVTLTATGRERNEQVVTVNDVAEREVFATIDPGLLDRLARDLRALLLATEGPAPPPRDAR